MAGKIKLAVTPVSHFRLVGAGVSFIYANVKSDSNLFLKLSSTYTLIFYVRY